jgi:hypothetical protein
MPRRELNQASTAEVTMPEVEETAQAEPARTLKVEHEHEESEMSGISENLDKININMPGADGGNAALMAALAGGGMGRDQNNLWPIILLALLRGRGGLGGDDGGDGINPILFNQITQTLGDIKGAIPAAAASTENVILQQTNALNSALASLGLGVQAGFTNLGDKVTNSATVVLGAVNNDGDKTRALIQSINDANLQRELTVAQNALADERHNRRSRDVEVNVTQQVNQQQQQAQFQAQIGGLLSAVQGLMLQNSRQAQDIVNLGTMTASGTQAAANTQVR